MGILYNANSTPTVNDSSVTSGNADGWIYAGGNSLDANASRPISDQSTRRTADGRPQAPLAKAGKQR